MFSIGPIDYNKNNYHLVRNSKKVRPIDKIDNVSSNRSNSNSDSSEFQKCLEEEIRKQKMKIKKEENNR